jgi:hypothetical protein
MLTETIRVPKYVLPSTTDVKLTDISIIPSYDIDSPSGLRPSWVWILKYNVIL